MVFYTLVLQFYFKNGQKKKHDDAFLSEKNRRKKRDTCRCKLQGESFEKKYKKI